MTFFMNCNCWLQLYNSWSIQMANIVYWVFPSNIFGYFSTIWPFQRPLKNLDVLYEEFVINPRPPSHNKRLILGIWRATEFILNNLERAWMWKERTNKTNIIHNSRNGCLSTETTISKTLVTLLFYFYFYFIVTFPHSSPSRALQNINSCGGRG